MLPPVHQFIVQGLLHPSGLQPQRVAAEIANLLTLVDWKVKLPAVIPQGILLIASLGKGESWLVIHHETGNCGLLAGAKVIRAQQISPFLLAFEVVCSMWQAQQAAKKAFYLYELPLGT
jgi:hypothetical protein